MVFTLATFVTIACNRKRVSGDNKGDGDNQQKTFATSEAAAIKAKSDLLEVIRSGKGINLGLDAAAVERSKPADPIKQFQITFDNLLTADSTGGLNNLQQNEISTMVPLVDNRIVATIIEVGKDNNRWHIASLANKEISNDLNVIQRSIGDTSKGAITIYNLPHSRVKLYAFIRDNTEWLFSNYPGFSIQQPVPANRLLPLIKRDAAEFQRRFANDLKNQKLVH